MTRILVVNASPNPDTSQSRALTRRYVDGLKARDKSVHVVHRDVGLMPLPHIDQEMIAAYFTPEDERSEEQKDRLALSDELVAEIVAADLIVIGTPMLNFGIPSTLKAWIDHIARVGVTFKYTEDGPKGLLGGRKVVVMATSGGIYTEGSKGAHMNHQTPYLKTVLGFVGLDDVTVVAAPGTAMGEDGIRDAEREVDRLLSERATEQAA